MKRIEVVVSNSALEAFRESAAQLGILEFETTEVRRSCLRQPERQRVFRGQAYATDLSLKTKIAFLVADEEVERIVRDVATAVRPDSISILTIYQIDLTNLGATGTGERRPAAPNVVVSALT